MQTLNPATTPAARSPLTQPSPRPRQASRTQFFSALLLGSPARLIRWERRGPWHRRHTPVRLHHAPRPHLHQLQQFIICFCAAASSQLTPWAWQSVARDTSMHIRRPRLIYIGYLLDKAQVARPCGIHASRRRRRPVVWSPKRRPRCPNALTIRATRNLYIE
jgi:hypothetical protein